LLEEFATEPLQIHVVYPHPRLMPTRVRAFVDDCVKQLRPVSFD
jgi:DNA-binding transcriptional LysR family regulator